MKSFPSLFKFKVVYFLKDYFINKGGLYTDMFHGRIM